MLCLSSTGIPWQYHSRTQSYRTLSFFANICAHLHIRPKAKYFHLSLRALIMPTISACFQNCSPSLSTHSSRLSRLSFSLLSLSAALSQSPASSPSASSVCFFLLAFAQYWRSYLATYLACHPPVPPTAALNPLELLQPTLFSNYKICNLREMRRGILAQRQLPLNLKTETC